MIIIPAIDLIDNRCVRLSKGDYDTKTVYDRSPVDQAQEFEKIGVTHLHLVDLSGAKAGKLCHTGVLKDIFKSTSLNLDYGGGIKTEEDIKTVLQSGAKQISIGSISVKNPELLIRMMDVYGAEKFILAADVLDQRVMINAWADDSGITIFELIDRFLPYGLNYVMVTDISRDGMLSGSSVELYKTLRKRYPQLRLIASGGVSSIEELSKLSSIGMYGAIIGKAYYQGVISAEELAKFVIDKSNQK